MKTTVIVDYSPVAKARARVFQRPNGAFGAFTPQKTRDAEEAIKLAWINAKAPGYKRGVPLLLYATFVFARPKSHFGTGRNSDRLKGSTPAFHVQRPDGDNLIKCVKDALTGFAWEDDCQIVNTIANKRWVVPGENAHIRIELESLEA